jgi:hypothetical protein
MSFEYADFNSDFTRYLDFVSPKGGDPTYSVLKAHLAIEQVFRDYLERRVPHPAALKEARLGFMQRMHLVRAISDADPKHWSWTAIAKLNSIRNQLAHHLAPKELNRLTDEYIAFCVTSSNNPLPPKAGVTSSLDAPRSGRVYTGLDMVTGAIFAGLCSMLGMLPSEGDYPAPGGNP